jgi:hypothetical protein
VHHPRGEYSEQRFRASYQRVPSFQVAGAKSFDYSASKSSALALFLHYSPDEACYCVPTDLQARLEAFVLPPAPLNLQSSETLAEDEGLMIRLTEREALQEVVVMLRTIEQVRVQVSDKTSRFPATATLRLLERKAVRWRLSTPRSKRKTNGIRKSARSRPLPGPCCCRPADWRCVHGTRLELGPAGIKALSMPPAEVLRGLWKKWLKTTLFDEFSRVDAIKGQTSQGRVMTAVAPRRAAIEEALARMPGRPLDRPWTTSLNFMLASDRRFAVTHDAWKLYICERQYGSPRL